VLADAVKYDLPKPGEAPYDTWIEAVRVRWICFRAIGQLSVDPDFNPGPYGAYGQVDALALQPDGQIVIGGLLLDLGGMTRNKLGRLGRDGFIDLRFNPGVSELQEDGCRLRAAEQLRVPDREQDNVWVFDRAR
jgi:hypothetical protein